MTDTTKELQELLVLQTEQLVQVYQENILHCLHYITREVSSDKQDQIGPYLDDIHEYLAKLGQEAKDNCRKRFDINP